MPVPALALVGVGSFAELADIAGCLSRSMAGSVINLLRGWTPARPRHQSSQRLFIRPAMVVAGVPLSSLLRKKPTMPMTIAPKNAAQNPVVVRPRSSRPDMAVASQNMRPLTMSAPMPSVTMMNGMAKNLTTGRIKRLTKVNTAVRPRKVLQVAAVVQPSDQPDGGPERKPGNDKSNSKSSHRANGSDRSDTGWSSPDRRWSLERG